MSKCFEAITLRGVCCDKKSLLGLLSEMDLTKPSVSSGEPTGVNKASLTT
ncbi:hypothetical protein [Legionella anisa]|nr:hypothetical protein [Legionella anisa]MCW8426733.1 hypothetical protein [Legionella anisa]